jgi:hypothetical protein
MAITPKRLVDGTQLGIAAAVLYTATNVRTRIDACAITNTTSAAVTATVHLVPAAASPTASNRVLDSYSIAAGQTYVPPGVIGQWLEEGGTLQALASAATSLSLVASGVEYSG